MNDLLALIVHHGYVVIFLIVLGEALGIPVPAALALVAGGAAVASGTLRAPAAALAAVTAMLVGDSLLYVLGSHMGWRLLGLLCRVSVDPETCILRSAESFYRRGRATLLIAKFIPGVNSMAPPLAGSMKMPFLQFLGLDFLGATAYALAYGGVGFIFRDFVATIARGFRAAGHAVEVVVIITAIAFRLSCLAVLEASGLPHRSTHTGRRAGREAPDSVFRNDSAGRCAQPRLLRSWCGTYSRVDSNGAQ